MRQFAAPDDPKRFPIRPVTLTLTRRYFLVTCWSPSEWVDVGRYASLVLSKESTSLGLERNFPTLRSTSVVIAPQCRQKARRCCGENPEMVQAWMYGTSPEGVTDSWQQKGESGSRGLGFAEDLFWGRKFRGQTELTLLSLVSKPRRIFVSR
jgi:hypothetical protein